MAVLSVWAQMLGRRYALCLGSHRWIGPFLNSPRLMEGEQNGLSPCPVGVPRSAMMPCDLITCQILLVAPVESAPPLFVKFSQPSSLLQLKFGEYSLLRGPMNWPRGPSSVLLYTLPLAVRWPLSTMDYTSIMASIVTCLFSSSVSTWTASLLSLLNPWCLILCLVHGRAE